MAWVVYALRRLAWALALLRARLRRPPAWVTFLVETPPPVLTPPRGPFWRRFLGRPPLSLRELERRLRAAAADPAVKGVVLHLRPLTMPAADAQALAALVSDLRRSGKRAVSWSPAYTPATYAVACACDEILLQPGGEVGPLGFAREYLYLADALERVGVRADLLQVSPYKTAGDVLSKRRMTAEAREMADWLADADFAELLTAVGNGRGLDEAGARRLVDGSPYTDEQALSAGAVDATMGEEELPAHLGGQPRSWEQVRRRLRPLPPPPPGRVVGLLRVEGLIVDGRSRRAPLRLPLPLLGADQAGDLTVVQQARRLAQSRRVAAVVLWVDSPGGSATASEAMAAALTALGARKPLVAAMGAVAASGGYYVTTPARRVFAQPGTVTGSIGVLAGKLVTAGLMDRLLFNRAAIVRGDHAAMHSPDRPYSEPERARLRAAIDRSYQQFVGRVAAGRRLGHDEVEAVAGGRVWTGRQALERRLVDELGGLGAALAEARRLAGLRATAPVLEARGGGADLPPAGSGVAAMAEHALAAARGLTSATAWWICPWWSPGRP